MKILILLDRKFPYKSGEAFLENEIEEISNKFDKVLIYPSDINKNDKITRNIKSKNVELRVFEKNPIKLRKIRYLLNIPRYVFRKTDAKKLKEKLFESYFLAAADIQSKKIIKELNKMSFNSDDEIYIYSYWLYITAKVACKIKEYFKSKGIMSIAISRAHRFDIYKENHKMGYIPQRKELLENLDHIYACSSNGSEYLKNNFSKYKDKISASYLGTYDRGVSKRDKDDTFKIVSCSRLSEVKRVDLIIEALKALKDSNIKLSWTHLGGGELYEELNNKAKDELKFMKVNMLGQMKNTEIYDHYLKNSFDLFINVSSSEGLPVSIMEATSFGIPVIATDVGGTSEIVIDGKNGYLLDKNFKPLELSKMINMIATMKDDEYSTLRKNSRSIWENNYQAKVNYEKFANSILDEYKRRKDMR